ncbi:MAG: SIS domain-containing protein [Pseudomonadota bacterium]
MTALVHYLASIPRILTETIILDADIATIAQDLTQHSDATLLGRGIHYPIALEAGHRLKEISFMHAGGYAAGELKHRSIALNRPDMPVIVFDSVGLLQEKTLSNAAEVKVRGARLWHFGHHTDDGIRRTKCAEIVALFSYAVVTQMLAYHAALAPGQISTNPAISENLQRWSSLLPLQGKRWLAMRSTAT